MSERHYLLRVLGLSTIPKFVTFGLTLLSFPMMVRATGAAEYGIFVFVGSTIAVLEAFVDFGVSSAAGKEMASVRELRPQFVRREFFAWARLQTMCSLIGLAPLLGASYLFIRANSNMDVELPLMMIMVVAAWITIAVNFMRANLLSLVAFKSLAVLDTFESVVRSAGFLAVALILPTALGLAIAALVTAIASSALAAILIGLLIGRNYSKQDRAIAGQCGQGTMNSIKYMVGQSASFLWLRLATRLFQALPLLIFGRMFGAEVVGTVGAFQKIVDLINLPFSVIGNALAVRAQGISAKGTEAVHALWDAAFRFLSTSTLPAATIFLGSGLLAQFLLPESKDAPALIAILAIIVVTSSNSSLIAPMSDYVGALRRRNILLTVFAFVQVPLLWIGAKSFGPEGAISAYALVLILMNVGYVLIALEAFFATFRYRFRFEVLFLIGVVMIALVAGKAAEVLGPPQFTSGIQAYLVALSPVFVLWSIVFSGLAMNKQARAYYFSRRFFEFEPMHTKLTAGEI